jgi:very-short-patch-repair endonuclease
VFRGTAAVRDDHLTPAHLRSRAWVRLFPDVYACASLPVTHRLRTLAAARLLLPNSVVRGRSAATWWGAELADADDDVELLVPPSCRGGAARGVRVARTAVTGSEVRLLRGVRVTSPVRTSVDLARIRPRDEAVVLLDQFTAAGYGDLAAARRAAAALTGRDCRSVRQALEQADGLAQSPQETRLRLLVTASALPRPVAQFTVSDRGRFVARVDFAWPGRRLALEYDGLWHAEPGQFAADRARLNRLLAAGWRVLFVTAADLRRPEVLLARIAAALAA